MTGNLDMGGNKIIKVDTFDDHKVDDDYDTIVKDLKSAVNKEYRNTKFLKRDSNDNDFDLRQKVIRNCAPYYDGLFSTNDLVSRAFVDTELAKIPLAANALPLRWK